MNQTEVDALKRIMDIKIDLTFGRIEEYHADDLIAQEEEIINNPEKYVVDTVNED